MSGQPEHDENLIYLEADLDTTCMLRDLFGAAKAMAALSEGFELIEERDGKIAREYLGGLNWLAHFAEDRASRVDEVISHTVPGSAEKWCSAVKKMIAV